MEPVAEKADRLKALLSGIRGRYVLTRHEKVIGLREHYALVLWKEKKMTFGNVLRGECVQGNCIHRLETDRNVSIYFGYLHVPLNPIAQADRSQPRVSGHRIVTAENSLGGWCTPLVH